jgi:hypothetical protein
MTRKLRLILAAFAFSVTATAQTISLDWVQSETYGVHNGFGIFAFDKVTNDVVSEVSAWMDQANSIHANALNRRNQQGQMVWDTLFDDTSYLNYRVRAFYPKNGETYYCLNYQASDLIFEKVNAAGQLVWLQQIPRSTLFFAFDRNMKGNNYVIDDSLNNRVLWMFEQWDVSFTTKNIGILATDNATGAITIIDTLSHSGPTNYSAFAVELQRDQNNHIYMSSTDENGGMRISLLDNGQWLTVAAQDSVGVRDFPQSVRIVENTMFVTTQTEVNSSNSVNKLHIYSIDNAGHLTLISVQNMSDTQHYILGMRTFGSNCYAFTSGWTNSFYSMLVPMIWKYDNAGNLVTTFAMTAFTNACISDLAVTNNAIYCSMYSPPGYNMLEVIDPVAGQHLANYWLLQEFTAAGNDAVYQMEAFTVNAGSDVIFAAGNQWVTNTHLVGRIAKYVYNGLESGAEEMNADPLFTIFPNPASEQVFVDYEKDKYMIEISDAAGKIVLTQKAETSHQLIDLWKLSNGVYFIRVVDGERAMVRRVVKE